MKNENFNNNLQFQIKQKQRFEEVIHKIPTYKEQLEEAERKIQVMINKLDNANRREIYKNLVIEFKNLLH